MSDLHPSDPTLGIPTVVEPPLPAAAAPKFRLLGLDATKHHSKLGDYFAHNPLEEGKTKAYYPDHIHSKFHGESAAHRSYEAVMEADKEMTALRKRAAEIKGEGAELAREQLGKQIADLEKRKIDLGKIAHGHIDEASLTVQKAHQEVTAAYEEAKKALAEEMKSAKGPDAMKAVSQRAEELKSEFDAATRELAEHQRLTTKARAEIAEKTSVRSVAGKEASIAVEESKAAGAAASGGIGNAFKNVGANWEAGGGARWKAGIGSVVALGFGLDGSKKVLRGLGILPKGHNPDGSEKNEGGVFIGSAEIAAAVAALMVAGKGAAR